MPWYFRPSCSYPPSGGTIWEWDRLWWVRVRGTARTTASGPDHRDAVRLMVDKYPQLVDTPPTGAVIILEIDEWLGWTARQSES